MRLQPKVRELTDLEIQIVAGGMHPVFICKVECSAPGVCGPTVCTEVPHEHP